MKAAIYARYSSENQRPESITDQVESCRKLAATRGYEISSEHVFSDEAHDFSVQEDFHIFRLCHSLLHDGTHRQAWAFIYQNHLAGDL